MRPEKSVALSYIISLGFISCPNSQRTGRRCNCDCSLETSDFLGCSLARGLQFHMFCRERPQAVDEQSVSGFCLRHEVDPQTSFGSIAEPRPFDTSERPSFAILARDHTRERVWIVIKDYSSFPGELSATSFGP